jgi:hypothetical protein
MRALLLIPASLAVTVAGGVALCAGMGWNPHPTELATGCAVMLAACVAGALPVLLARHATQLGMSQAALVGTMAHLFVAAALVGGVIVGKFPLHPAFIYWSMALYWSSLIALVAVLIRAIKAAPIATATKA